MVTIAVVRIAIALVGILAIVTAGALFFSPREALQRGSRLRRILLEADLTIVFDRRFAIERRVYRRHRMFGLLVMGGTLAALSLLWMAGSSPAVAAALGETVSRELRMAALAGTLLALTLFIVGVVLFVRPSALKGVEALANRWIDPVGPSPSSAAVSRLVSRAPRATGMVLFVAGVVCLAVGVA